MYCMFQCAYDSMMVGDEIDTTESPVTQSRESMFEEDGSPMSQGKRVWNKMG